MSRDIAFVTWRDSALVFRWIDADELADLHPVTAQSVGLVLRDDAEGVVLCLNEHDDGEVSQCIAIPRSAIVTIYYIRRAGQATVRPGADAAEGPRSSRSHEAGSSPARATEPERAKGE